MKAKIKTRFKQALSCILACIMAMSNLMQISVSAEEPEKYPYSMFGRNGVVMTANNLCINGNIHTNKEADIASIGGNINGKITTGNDIEKRIKHVYADQKIMETYFTENCDLYEEEYVYSDMNIHINNPIFCYNNIFLDGNVALNSNLGSLMNINITGEVKNANTSVVYSKYGDITIENDSTANINGLIYAPLGTLTIDSPNINLNGVIIADKIVINGGSVNINYKDDIASFIGTTSEAYDFSGLEYLPEDWLGDTDEDGLFDIYEKVIDTDPLNPDTDGDGLPDGYEVIALNTDPLEIDTDENGISDADEDFDNDNLSNLGEYQNQTEPFNFDTDEDGFMDGDEVYTYGTEPLNPDTDNDGLLDGEESYDGSIYAKYGVYFDPLNPDTNGNGVLDGDEIFGQSKQQEVETYDKAITEITVDMNTNGNLERNLTVESMYNIDAMSTNVYAMIGEPFNFTSSTDFESATITFKIDQSTLGDTLFDNLIILWYNEEDQVFEEMPTTRDAANSTVSTTTTHFSQYMVVDSVKWYQNWNNSLNEIRKMWIDGTSYQRNLHTILMVDCSSSMVSTDYSSPSLQIGYKGVTEENIETIRNSINSPNDVEAYCVNWCTRAEICHNIINSKGNNDAVAVIRFSNTVIADSGLSYEKSYLNNQLPSITNGSGAANLNSALNRALSHVETDTTDLYRLVVVTDNNINFGQISSADFSENVIFNIVNLGSSAIGYGIEDVAQATGGDVYNAISANDLTYQSGGFVHIPEQFIGEDSDGDGLPDLVELYGLKPNGEPINTNPYLADSDGDGIDDNVELGYIPGVLTSNATIADYVKALKPHSDPTKPDTDGDGFPDNYNEDTMSAEKYYPYADPNPWESDVTEIALKNDFFSVDYEYKDGVESNWSNDGKTSSYGGYQGWFGSYGYTGDEKIFCNQTSTGYKVSNYGCGLIALADMFLYLAIGDASYNPTYAPSNILIDLGSNYDHIDFDTYILYITLLSNYFTIYGEPVEGIPAVGLLGNLESGINTISRVNDMGITATWESSTDSEKTLEKIKEMINNDIPAVFSYSVTFADELQLYRFVDHEFTINEGTSVRGHYMVATGVIEYSDDIKNIIGRKRILRVATYGKEYYVDYDEYAEQLSSIDTNIMYIKK